MEKNRGKNKTFWTVLLVCSAVLASCSKAPKTSAEAVARDFMEAYYVRADLNQATAFADGYAMEKLKTSLALREGLTVDSAAHQPKVRFQLVQSKSGPEESDFFYEVEFRPEKAEAVRKKTRVKVRLRDGLWKVTQFSDHEP